jgi:predicted dehydrogenase
MPDAFRLGIVGMGRISGESHLPAALASVNIKVTALVDTCVERASQLAQAFGIKPRITDSLSDILPEVDGVIIATPNNSHCSIAVECLNSGVHVLIEKPMAVCVEQCQEILDASKKSGAVATVGCSTRFKDEVIQMTQLLNSGFFGTIKRFAYEFGTRGGWDPVSGYILDRKAGGGGVVTVAGSHFLDRMLYWFGYPQSICYADDSLGGPEANAEATLTFDSNGSAFQGFLRFSKTIALNSGLVMETDRGIVLLHESQPPGIWFRPDSLSEFELLVANRTMTPGQGQTVYQRQLENFVGACQGTCQLEVSGQQGLESIRLIEAMYSQRTYLDYDSFRLPSGAAGP